MIEAHGLTRKFGTLTAVSQLSLKVPSGSILALLGPNGAGKTTTVRMLAGLLAPTEGDAIVGGYDIRKEPDAVRACTGLVTDVPGLYEQMNVVAYLDFFGRLAGMPAAVRSQRIDELLKLFELNEHRNEKMVGFSKGMKQKVALARALLHEPAVLFLDEPTSGLDPLSARTVRELIIRLKHSSRSIILCTHDLDEAERLADVVAIMRQGKIVASGAPARLREHATGEARVRVEFADPCPLTLDELKRISGVNAPQFVSIGEPGGETQLGSDMASDQHGILEYRTAQPKVVNPQVLTRLVMAGAQVISVICETQTLEDVYATMIGSADGVFNSIEKARMIC
jgi:ABC-2 type transport system ATP-binding protein